MTIDTLESKAPKIHFTKRRVFKGIVVAVLAALLTVGSYAGYIYVVSPEVIRNPKLEHYHFRMQILIDGKAENFANQNYQTGYKKDLCNVNLPEQPIHFHDNKDQFTHIHWEGMTGGMVMKYYGWNYIGGMDNALGYKLDNLNDIQTVTTHGNYLPNISKDARLYIYTGDEKNYQEKSFDDWKNKDLEQFFGKTSNLPSHEMNKNGEPTSFLENLFPTAYAHSGEDNSQTATATQETEDEKLTRINNLLGNVVIFAQEDKPTDEQVKNRFNKLAPLTESTCGG